MDDVDAETARHHFSAKVKAMRRGCPQKDWARRYGLSAGALRDLEQGRVLPSRAMILWLNAIDACPELMQRVVRESAEEIGLLTRSRALRN